MDNVYAKDYQIMPDSDVCQIENFTKMLAEHTAGAAFVFGPGRYHFYLDHAHRKKIAITNSDPAEEIKTAILLENMSNILLDGRGAEFWFHGDMISMVVSDCSQIELKNFSINYDVPGTAEAKVLSAGADAVEIRLDHALFPYHVEKDTLFFDRGFGEKAPMFGALEFDGKSGKVRDGAGDTFPKVKAREVKQDIVRLEGRYDILPKAGNILALRHGKRVHPGALFQYSEDIRLKEIVMHQSFGLGVVFQFCKDIEAFSVTFCPNAEGGFRVVAGHDDGLHFSNNRGRILIENCKFQGLLDDPVNVHGTYAFIEACTDDDHKLRGVFLHPQSKGFNRWASEGDLIGFLNPSDRMYCALAFAKDYRLLSRERFELELQSSVPAEAKAGFAMENLTNTPSLTCRKNIFGSCRARGVLVTTPKPVLIEDNVFESSGSAVLLAGDAGEWYESGNCTDVTIRGNEFVNCCTSEYEFCKGAIHIEPGVPDGGKAVHQNIRVLDNVFHLSSGSFIYADHAGKLDVKGNRIFINEAGPLPGLLLRECEDICFENNEINISKND